LGSAVLGVGVHYYYRPEWQKVAVNSLEYLFDLFPARSVVYGADQPWLMRQLGMEPKRH
jgi:hypothetical protein